MVAWLASVAEEAFSIFCISSFALVSGLTSVRCGTFFHQNLYGLVVVVVMIIIIIMFIIIIIIIIIIRHQLGLDRPVSASSNNLFEGLPSRLSPFGP